MVSCLGGSVESYVYELYSSTGHYPRPDEGHQLKELLKCVFGTTPRMLQEPTWSWEFLV